MSKTLSFPTVRLGDLCSKIGSGATPRGGSDVYKSSGAVALIRSQNIHNNLFVPNGLAFIEQTHADELRNVIVESGDVLLNITGDSVARCAQAPRHVLPARVNQHVAIIRPNRSRLISAFLRYFLVSPAMQETMLGLAAAGATRNALTKSMIEDFSVPCPSVDIQLRIADILGSLDDKIELNRRINETLEAMARALFRSWFVDFDPVHAKSAVRREHPNWTNAEVSRAALPNVAPGAAELFPDRFEESSIGPIPMGWRRSTLREITDVFSGGTPSKGIAAYWNGPIPWISPKAMNKIHVNDSDDRVTESAIGNGTRLAPKGSVLVMVRGMGLHQGVRISQAQIDVTFNQDVKALVPKTVNSTFLLHAMLNASPFLFSKVQASGHGTGVLPTDILDSVEFIIPPTNACDKLSQSLTYINSLIAANERDSLSLTALRDTLLPKLLSGELSVANGVVNSLGSHGKSR